jgi:hypothetical protein
VRPDDLMKLTCCLKSWFGPGKQILQFLFLILLLALTQVSAQI